MYQEMGGAATEALPRIQNDLMDFARIYGTDQGAVVLAALEVDPNAFVGGVCLTREIKLDKDNIGKHCCQIRYLWVAKDYRKLSISSKLIDVPESMPPENPALASSMSKSFPSLRGAVHLVTTKGFRFTRDFQPSAPDRYVFRLDI